MGQKIPVINNYMKDYEISEILKAAFIKKRKVIIDYVEEYFRHDHKVEMCVCQHRAILNVIRNVPDKPFRVEATIIKESNFQPIGDPIELDGFVKEEEHIGSGKVIQSVISWKPIKIYRIKDNENKLLWGFTKKAIDEIAKAWEIYPVKDFCKPIPLDEFAKMEYTDHNKKVQNVMASLQSSIIYELRDADIFFL